MRFRAILLLGLLLTPSLLAKGTELPGLRGGNFLGVIDDLRSRSLLLLETRGRRDSAALEARRDRDLLQMYEALYQQHAASSEELAGARLRRDVSQQAEKRLEAVIERVEALRDESLRLVDFLQGKPLSLETLHEIFVRGWKAQCRERHEAAVEAEARVRYTHHLWDIGRKLLSTHSISREEYLQRQTDALGASAVLDAARKGDVACEKELPMPALKDLPT